MRKRKTRWSDKTEENNGPQRMSYFAMEPVNILQSSVLNISGEFVNCLKTTRKEAIMNTSSTCLAEVFASSGRTLQDDPIYNEILMQSKSVANNDSTGSLEESRESTISGNQVPALPPDSYLSDISSDSFQSLDNLDTANEKEPDNSTVSQTIEAECLNTNSNCIPDLRLINDDMSHDPMELDEISSTSIPSEASSDDHDNVAFSTHSHMDEFMSDVASLDLISKCLNIEVPIETREYLCNSGGKAENAENITAAAPIPTAEKNIIEHRVIWEMKAPTPSENIEDAAKSQVDTGKDDKDVIQVIKDILGEIVEMSILRYEEDSGGNKVQGEHLSEEDSTEPSSEVQNDTLDIDNTNEGLSDVASPIIITKSSRHSENAQKLPELIPINTRNRLQMAQIIEKKLQSTLDEEQQQQNVTTEEETSTVENPSNECDVDSSRTEEEESTSSPEIKKPPLIGCIRKSKRRAARATKPPWLKTHGNGKMEDDGGTQALANTESKIEDGKDETTNDNIAEVNNVKSTDDENSTSEMREKLFSQLQMLKVKRKSEPLVSTSVLIQNCSNVYFEKRSVKPLLLPSVNSECESSLGIKIVAVAGGVDIDNCEGLLPIDSSNETADDVDMEEEAEEKPPKEVIINEHLDLPTIKLTKTNDYTKIKGWNKKKLLAQNEESTEEMSMNIESTPSCSYSMPKVEQPTCEEDVSEDLLDDRKEITMTSPEVQDNLESEDLPEDRKEIILTMPEDKEINVFESNNMESEDVIEDSKEITMTMPEDQEINVFASNNLEGFLQEKDLNISYNVPNLKSSNHNINLLDNCVLVDINQDRKSIDNDDSNSSSSFKEQLRGEALKSDAPKPRTLAEKRKMMLDESGRETRYNKRCEAKRFKGAKPKKNEVAQAEDDLLVPISKQPLPLQVHSPAGCLQISDVVFLNEEQSKPKETFVSQVRFRWRRGQYGPYSVVSRKAIKRSYWWRYSDVPRKSSIQYIPKEDTAQKNKVSILKTLSNVEYKPGPLSKKDQLQTKGQSRWRTIIRDLPKVSVEVTPEVGKVLHPSVRPFIQFNAVKISEERADFAVSMLRHKNCVSDPVKAFTFPAHYEHHQEKVVLRQIVGPQSSNWTALQSGRAENKQQTMRSIENVIDQMLDYVEIKVQEDSYIKEDPLLRESQRYAQLPNDVTKTTPDKSSKSKIRLNAEAKKRNLERALKTLNVLVVDMPKQPTTLIEDCKKDFCKLGCICQSISSKYPTAEHCGEPKCMLQCVCGFELSHRRLKEHHQQQQQADLNEKTISRLQKEAKRNIIAREERDFTLTAIRAPDNTYIFNRSRRTPKYNYKKYEGFHVNFSTEEMRTLQDDPKISQCSVDVIRCDFAELVPFCMVHDLYDCHCKCLAKFDFKQQSQIDRLWSMVSMRSSEPSRVIETESRENDDALNLYERMMNMQRHMPVVTHPKSSKDAYENADALSARLRGTGIFYQSRNQTNTYKIKMARRLKYDKTVDQEIVNKWYILPSHSSAPVSDQKRQILANHSTHRRKQELKIRSLTDVNLTQEKSRITDAERLIKHMTTQQLAATNQQKIRPRIHRETLRAIAKTLATSGALYAPTLSISQKFAQMIGNRQATSEFRLLLWPSLAMLYSLGDIQIWFNNANNKLRFVVTDGLTTPKGGYDNVKIFEDRPQDIKADFIKWIVTNTLPENKQAENILVILKMNECYWEICGICAKSPSSGNKHAKARRDMLMKHQQAMEERHRMRMNAELTDKRANLTSALEEITPVDEKYYKCSQQVHFCHGNFSPKSLSLLDMNDTRVDAEVEIIVALPRAITAMRWRVLKINSNFAILAFANRSFNIKCSDILKVMTNASRHNKAIIIKSPECFVGYASKAFGIYVAPNFHDRIFIGPYEMDEEHKIETLRFVNNKLIHLEVFNAMRGHKNIACTGVWYTQQPAPLVRQLESVIDLTEVDITITSSKDCVRMPSLVAEGKENEEIDSSSESISVDSPPPTPVQSTIMKNGQLAEVSNATNIKPGRSLLADRNDKVFKLPKPPQKLHANNMEKLRVRSNLSGTECELFGPVSNSSCTPIMTHEQEVDAIMQQARISTPPELDRLFQLKLLKLMQNLNLIVPNDARLICFRLNFGNGIILGFFRKVKVFVFWPGAKMPRIEFDSVSEAIDWLQKELHAVFICIPSTFKIVVAPVCAPNYMDYIQRNVISQKYFHEVCIIGDFGIMRLNEAEPYLLLDSVEEGRLKVQEAERTEKFKKAINAILDKNDMNKEQFSKKVSDLVRRAKAAADGKMQSNSKSVTSPSASTTSKAQPSTSILIKNQNVHIGAKRCVKLPPNQLISVNNDLLPLASVAQNSGLVPAAKTKSVTLRSDARTTAQPPLPRLAPLASKKDDVMCIDLTHMSIDDAKILIKRVYGVDIKELKKITVKRPLVVEGTGNPKK